VRQVISLQISKKGQTATDMLLKTHTKYNTLPKNKQRRTRWLYCVECPQYSTRRRSASNIHRSSMLRKTGRYGKPSNISINLHRKKISIITNIPL